MELYKYQYHLRGKSNYKKDGRRFSVSITLQILFLILLNGKYDENAM